MCQVKPTTALDETDLNWSCFATFVKCEYECLSAISVAACIALRSYTLVVELCALMLGLIANLSLKIIVAFFVVHTISVVRCHHTILF